MSHLIVKSISIDKNNKIKICFAVNNRYPRKYTTEILNIEFKTRAEAENYILNKFCEARTFQGEATIYGKFAKLNCSKLNDINNEFVKFKKEYKSKYILKNCYNFYLGDKKILTEDINKAKIFNNYQADKIIKDYASQEFIKILINK